MSLIELVVKRVIKLKKAFAHIMKAVKNNTGFIVTTATISTSERPKYMDERAMIEERCRKYVEAETSVDQLPSRTRWKLEENRTQIFPTTSEQTVSLIPW